MSTLSAEPAPVAQHARWPGWLLWSLELAGLLTLAAYLFFDRLALYRNYLTKYFDEDQAIEWHAARELLRGKLHEPCFFGQSYNSNLEGYLAAPLVAMHVPYEFAVPLVSLLLGLLPYVVMAWVAFRRRQPLVAGLALLVPLAMSTRFGIITGMPRGFVTGIAVGIFPAMLFLPAWRKTDLTAKARRREGKIGHSGFFQKFFSRLRAFAVWKRRRGSGGTTELATLRRSWPITRYFFAGLLAVVAGMLNPNAAVLLLPVAVFALFSTFMEWRFWVFAPLGCLVGGIYPYFVHQFYFVWHDDWRLYLREKRFTWSYENFRNFVPKLDDAFHDLVPDNLYAASETFITWLHGRFPRAVPEWAFHSPACVALVLLFAAVFVLLILRVRVAAAFATLAGVGLTIFAMAYDRLQNSRTSVSFPFARMYLAVPVLLIWLLLLLKRPARVAVPVAATPKAGWRWWSFARRYGAPAMTIAILAAMVFAGRAVAMAKAATLTDDLADLVENADTARPIEVAEGKRVAKAVQKVADAQHVTMVLITNYDGRKYDYLLPELTTCETLYPNYERRTWRLYEECFPRWDKIMVLGDMNRPVRAKDFPSTRGAVDPPIRVYSLNGRSVDDFCRMNGIRARDFVRPANAPPTTRPR